MDLSLVVAAGVGLASLWLMWRQLRVMDRQLDLMARQDEILAHRAKLEVLVEVWPRRPGEGPTLDLLALNSGSKSAADFHWHIYVPLTFSADQLLNIGGGFIGASAPLDIGGVPCREFDMFKREPVYPGRTVRLGSIRSERADLAGRVGIPWRLNAEDGAFPSGENTFGTTWVDV